MENERDIFINIVTLAVICQETMMCPYSQYIYTHNRVSGTNLKHLLANMIGNQVWNIEIEHRAKVCM